MSYYLNPRNDIAFKKIFGDTKNKDILIHFLNDVLDQKDRGPIVDVTLINPAQLPEIADLKESILDVLCTDDHGIQYIVEMQVSGSKGFAKRAQYYAAKAYSQQAKKKGTYHSLKAVIFLAILDFVMFPDKPQYKSDHVILDKETYAHDLKDFSFTFIELPKFTKKDPATLKTFEDKWCYFLKYAGEPEEMRHFWEVMGQESGVIHKAYEILEAHHWTEEELLQYERMEKVNMDMQAREEFVIDKAKAEGKVEGKAEGMAEGEALGIKMVAKNLKILGMSLEKIAEATGLSLDEISKL
jgi:predicted transposase/invertase (TIGR01784 family)